MERNTVLLLGVVTYSVHWLAYQKDNDQNNIQISRRFLAERKPKATFQGFLTALLGVFR